MKDMSHLPAAERTLPAAVLASTPRLVRGATVSDRHRKAPATRRETVASLVRRCQAGDGAALRPLVNTLQPVLTRDAFRILRDSASAEDAFMEAIEGLVAHIDDIEHPDRFLTYARRAARNAALDLYRTRNRRDSVRALRDTHVLEASRPPGTDPLLEGLPSAGGGPEARVATERRSRRIREAVDRLREPRRTAVLRYYFEGWTLEDVGAELGMSGAGAKRILGSARAALGARLRRLELAP